MKNDFYILILNKVYQKNYQIELHLNQQPFFKFFKTTKYLKSMDFLLEPYTWRARDLGTTLKNKCEFLAEFGD